MSNFTPDLRQERDELREQLRAANERIAELEKLCAPSDTGDGPQSRQRLLARMAGNIAAGLAPHLARFRDANGPTAAIAGDSVAIAEDILRRLGL